MTQVDTSPSLEHQTISTRPLTVAGFVSLLSWSVWSWTHFGLTDPVPTDLAAKQAGLVAFGGGAVAIAGLVMVAMTLVLSAGVLGTVFSHRELSVLRPMLVSWLVAGATLAAWVGIALLIGTEAEGLGVNLVRSLTAAAALVIATAAIARGWAETVERAQPPARLQRLTRLGSLVVQGASLVTALTCATAVVRSGLLTGDSDMLVADAYAILALATTTVVVVVGSRVRSGPAA